MLFTVSAQVRKVFALVLVAAFVTTTLSLSTAVTSASPRSGAFHVTKECSQYTGAADDICTITSSNVRALEVGSRIVYHQAMAADGSLDSDITIAVGPGNVARGHCTLNATTLLCTLSGETGKFTHFNASAAVSQDSAGLWHWDGTYSFSPAN